MKNPGTIVITNSAKMKKNTNTRGYNSNPFTGKPLSGDKRPSLETAICFYKVEDDDKFDSGYETYQ